MHMHMHMHMHAHMPGNKVHNEPIAGDDLHSGKQGSRQALQLHSTTANGSSANSNGSSSMPQQQASNGSSKA
jgi:hypothetical protein